MSWTDDRMDDLSEKVETMQGEMKEEFKAVRGEMKEEFKAVRGEMKEDSKALRSEIQSMRSDMDRRFDGLQASMTTMTVTVFATTTSGFIALLAAFIVQS